MQNLQVTLLPKPAFNDIVKSKNNPAKTELLLIQKDVEIRFDEYNSNKFNLEHLSGSPYLKNHDFLISCYESETIKRNETVAAIKKDQPNNTKGTCQYCCINSPKTIDHYLPKGIFPEFSVFTLNLIPCCGDCNQMKDEKVKDSNNIREFINFYFDDFLNIQFLFCDISIVGNEPVADFFIQNTNNLSSNNYKIIKNHFSNLRLFERYKDKINTEISEIKNSCEAEIAYGLDKTIISSVLLDRSQRNKKTFGVNYWKAVLMEGLANCQDFINIL